MELTLNVGDGQSQLTIRKSMMAESSLYLLSGSLWWRSPVCTCWVEVYDGGVQSVPVEWKSMMAESSLYMLSGMAETSLYLLSGSLWWRSPVCTCWVEVYDVGVQSLHVEWNGGVQSVPVEWKSMMAESGLYLLSGSLWWRSPVSACWVEWRSPVYTYWVEVYDGGVQSVPVEWKSMMASPVCTCWVEVYDGGVQSLPV